MSTNSIDCDTTEAVDLLAHLRARTAPAHQRLDAAFGALDLHRRGALARFLAAHLAGIAPLHAAFARFAAQDLALPCPDYPALLRADLADLGIPADALRGLATAAPADDAAGAGADAGTAYVVCGSRLGLTVIRREGYWGQEAGWRSRYMEDEAGLALWKALVPRLRAMHLDAPARDAASAAALAAFDSFGAAIAWAQGIEGIDDAPAAPAGDAAPANDLTETRADG